MKKLDDIINEIANEQIPEDRIEQAAGRVRQNLFRSTAAAPDRIRNCADYQALIPSYLNKTLSAGRALLLQDHTRECVACRRALQQARSESAPTLTRPATPPSRTIPRQWAIAAVALVAVALGAAIVVESLGVLSRGRAAVQTVYGILYTVSDRGSLPVFPGRELEDGQHIRTAKGSKAVIRLADGSLVELNERSEVSFARTARGVNIRLDRGGIIVQAAKQRRGTLDVLTPDCTVSVKGTIFAVDRGAKGSRVSVVEGSVNVRQGAQTLTLKPGDQTATDPSIARTSVGEAVSWSRDSSRYLALLGEFSVIRKGLEAMPSPGLRRDPKLLPYIDPNAVLYAAIPNLGPTLTEAERLFNERLQASEVLRAWWQEQKDGPKLAEMIDKLRTFSDYLGDEIVLTVKGDWEGRYSTPLILAEVKRPGLQAFLETEFRQLALQGGKDLPRVVPLQPAAAGSQPDAYYERKRRPRAADAKAEHAMFIGVNDRLIAIAWNQEDLDAVAGRLANPQPPDSGSLAAQVRRMYSQGVNYLLCVNMEHIARNVVDKNKNEPGPRLPSGFESMRYLVVERKDVEGRTENQATLTFGGQRSGMAAWLAEPSPMGSLDFVSPNATFAMSFALERPQTMLRDLFRQLAQSDPSFDEKLENFRRDSGVQLSPMLGEPLGGEFTFALDGPMLPLPSWKIVAEVYSTDRLQWAIEQLIDAINKDMKCAECRLQLAKTGEGGRTWYTITTGRFAYEIDYTYVDGYILIGPSRSLLARAIQNHDTGYVLSRSEGFRSQLPRDGRLNFSAILYNNIGSALAPLAEQLSAAPGASPAQRDSMRALASNTGPGLIYAYGQPDSITIASSGSFFGLDLNTFALPHLMRAMAPPAKGAKQIQ
jgi:ferric-dicitrate binding protein FerR (iron transport regulator)